jgi:ABC-type transport system substrate-binding protein
MNTKGIVAIAILGILLASTFAIIPAPLVVAQTDTLFDMTIIAPGNANLLRRQWGLIIANSFKAVGINANIVFLDWGPVYDRVLTPLPENIGKTWSEGGWDALEIGWSAGGPGGEMLGAFQIYYGQNLPPGSNYYLWQNASADALVRTFLVEGYNAEGAAAFDQWQLMQFDDVPASQIMFQSVVMSARNEVDFNGFDWIIGQLGGNAQFITGVTSYVLGSTGEPLDMCPPLSNSWYDTIAFSNLYDALYFVDNDFTYKPSILTNVDISPDGYDYTYTFRSGVMFHDGEEVTADDLLFSYLAYLNPNSGSQQSAYVSGFIGNDITFKWLNGTETRLVIDLDAGTGAYPATTETGDRPARIEAIDDNTFKVTLSEFPGLGAPTALWHPIDSVAILPLHAIGQLAPENWLGSPFDTGSGSVTIGSTTYTGPIGCGPYKWVGYDPATSLIHLTKFDDYWNASALEAEGFFTIEDFYVKYIVEKDSAIAALTNNEVQCLDANYQLQADYVAGNLAAFQNFVQTGAGIQQVGYNLRHPIWGTGVDTPNGQTDPANAALYAMYVRQALDYLIPRELIVDNLMSGIGDPADVHVNPISAYKNAAISPREYNPTKAKELLALAGYETGVTPGGPVVTPPGQGVTGWMLGAPILFFEKFDVGDIVTTVEQSTDGGVTFEGVAMGVTDSNGYFSTYYAPNITGNVTYRTVFTGYSSAAANDFGFTSPDFAWWELPASAQTAGATTGRALQYVVTSPALITAPQDAKIASMNSTINSMSSTINSLNSQITALNASLSSMSTIAYAAIVLAIVALLVGIVAFMRKK